MLGVYKLNPNMWSVDSATDYLKQYKVIKRRDNTFFCECKAFQFHSYECKHIKAVKEFIDLEYLQFLTRDELINECETLIKKIRGC